GRRASTGRAPGISWRTGPMMRKMLRAKIHRATVTQANVDYEGSITIDRRLMEATDLLPHEAVSVWDVTNGNRFETYAVEGRPDSGVVCVNGAAAHLVRPGDLVIIAAFTWLEEEAAGAHAEAAHAAQGARAPARQGAGARPDAGPAPPVLVEGQSEGGAGSRAGQEALRQARGDPRAHGAARGGSGDGAGAAAPAVIRMSATFMSRSP